MEPLPTNVTVIDPVIIVGATASGKSALAMLVADRFGGEIVNADSMQVYRRMDIGTAKPTKTEMEQIPHHLFDIVSPDVNFTAAAYSERARATIFEISSRGKLPVVVGGTGLYIRALFSGLVESPEGDASLREEYSRFAHVNGNAALHRLLQGFDPVAAELIHPNNRVRVIRALEVFRLTGRSIVEMQQQHSFALKWCNYLKIGINVERNELYKRINCRVDRMMEDGFVEEVRGLLSDGYLPELKAMSSIGYREICSFLAGELDLPEVVRLIRRNTRHYAKRQITWFKGEDDVIWFDDPVNSSELFNFIEKRVSKIEN